MAVSQSLIKLFALMLGGLLGRLNLLLLTEFTRNERFSGLVQIQRSTHSAKETIWSIAIETHCGQLGGCDENKRIFKFAV